jgi:phage FluMu protein Com
MEKLQKSSIRQSEVVNGFRLIKSINVKCPNCNEQVSAVKEKHTIHNGNPHSITYDMRCTSCNKLIRLWVPESDKSSGAVDIYMNGTISKEKPVMNDIDILPYRLQSAYLETVDVYKAGKWAATSVMSRRTLEGIVYYLNGADRENKKPLYNMLQDLPDKVDLTSKIIDLANGIRKAGNFGAHFDEDIEPDEEVATMLLEYIEYLLEFSFILPSRADGLSAKVDELLKAKDI